MLPNTYRISLLLLYCSFLAISCKMPTKKETHIAPDVMAELMVDIQMAETYSTMVKDSVHTNGKKNADSLAAFYKDILAHHNITMEQFSKSLDWYKSHPNEMDTLYNDMIPILTETQ